MAVSSRIKRRYTRTLITTTVNIISSGESKVPGQLTPGVTSRGVESSQHGQKVHRCKTMSKSDM